jgi:uncharacterized membrane protein
MPKLILRFLAGTVSATSLLAGLPVVRWGTPAQATTSPLPPSPWTFIDTNRAIWHRPSGPPAGIDLTALAFNLDDVDTFGRWLRALDAVRDSKMPPGGKNLSTSEREAFLAAINEPMMTHEQMKVAVMGRAVLRRLKP